MLPDFKLHYITIEIKTVWYWHKYRHRDKWNSGEPRNKPMLLWSTYYKGAKNIQWGKSLFNKWCWEKLVSYMQKNNFLTPYTKINSQIKDLNVRPWHNKTSRKKHRKNFDTDLRNILGGFVSSGKGNKSKNKQMGLHQTTNFPQDCLGNSEYFVDLYKFYNYLF